MDNDTEEAEKQAGRGVAGGLDAVAALDRASGALADARGRRRRRHGDGGGDGGCRSRAAPGRGDRKKWEGEKSSREFGEHGDEGAESGTRGFECGSDRWTTEEL